MLDGYHIEHAVACPESSFTYKIKSTLTLENTNLTQEYITAFNPRAFLKVWTRYLS